MEPAEAGEQAEGAPVATKTVQKAFKGEDDAGWLSRATFWWFLPVLRFGHGHRVEDKHIGAVARADEPLGLHDLFQREWDAEVKRASEAATGTKKDAAPDMVRVMLRTVGHRNIATATALAMVHVGSMTVVPFVSKRLLESLAEPEPDRTLQGGLAAAMVMLPLIGAYAQAQVAYVSRRGSMHLYTALTQAIFNKSLRLSSASRNTSSTGQLVNLIATDAGTALERSILLIYPLFLAPPMLAVLLYLVAAEVGISLLAGFLVMVVAMPLNVAIFMGITKAYGATIALADDRIKAINEALQAIRILKMYAWEIPFVAKIRAMRERELAKLRRHAFLFSVGMNAVFLQLPYLIQFATFTTFYMLDNPFLPWTVFTAIQLFQMVQQQLTQLPSALSQLSQSLVASRRISAFLQLPELTSLQEQAEDAPRAGAKAGTVVAEEASFTWDHEEDGGSNTLSDISFELLPGQKAAVLGKVASGKSSFLVSLTGEMRRTAGRAGISGSVAYSAQKPFILSATVRENILFGRPMDAARYKRVIRDCSLGPDLDMMPRGDETFIGERGINLSGGQKARLSFARAVYADADVLLLDDPLCAVDAHVGAAILERCIFGPLLAGKTLLFCTSSLSRIDEFDKVILLKEGRIAQQGPWAELEVDLHQLEQELEEAGPEEAPASTPDDKPPADKADKAVLAGAEAAAAAEAAVAERPTSRLSSAASEAGGEDGLPADQLFSEEEEALGTLKLAVLRYFVRTIGRRLFGSAYTLYVIYLFTPMVAQYILSYWSDEALCVADPSAPNCDRPERGSAFWFMCYCIVLVGGLGVCILAGILIALARVSGSRQLHNNLLEAVFKGSITNFFDVKPLGRILNRFAKDMSLIDFPLSQMLMFSVVTISYAAAALLGIVLGTTGLFLVLLVPVILAYGQMYRYMRGTAIQLQRLEAKARSPIYSNFAEVLNGLATIRAFAQSDRFVTKNRDKLTENVAAYFLARVVLPSCLMVSVNIIGGIIMAGVCAFVLLSDSIAPGAAGLALTYALQISQTLNAVTLVCTEFEISMNSVERVQMTTENVEPEDPLERNEHKPKLLARGAAAGTIQIGREPEAVPANWPERGVVEVSNLVVGYREGPDVLKSVSFTVQQGEKIGICGRTGSGKSSLLLALLRIVEPRSGTIRIDGVDICGLRLRDLRTPLAVIPQDPVIFQDTMRFNLDPFGERTDEELREALRAVQLESFAENLDLELVEGGNNVSEGQKQLVCFARAMLRRSRLLMLDEASAMLDRDTDRVLQKLVRDSFRDRTVITIAHRLETIMDSTRILVLDAGHVAEFGTPQDLLADPSSSFSAMVASANT